MRKRYKGTVVGYFEVKEGCFINYVETSRHPVKEGFAYEAVFSKEPYQLYDDIEYSIYRTERGYIARA